MLKSRLLWAGLLASVQFAPTFGWSSDAAPAVPDMKVTAWSLRVRTLNGDHFCSLPRGSQVKPLGITEDGERLRVSLSDSKQCNPNTGYVDVRYLRPAAVGGPDTFEEAQVDTDGLSLRSEPLVSASTYRCALSKSTTVSILPEEQRRGSNTSWFKVKLKSPIEGCPEEGWVAASYLRPALDMSALPVVREDQRARSESCTDCELAAAAPARGGIDGTADIARSIEKQARTSPSGRSPFLQALDAIKKNKGRCVKGSAYPCNRGLVQMPLVGRNAGFCGSNHYLPDNPTGVDAYAAPHTACALAAFAQEWKKTACPSGGGCRFSWGDISHRNKARWNGHVSHTDGECIDIRPLNKGSFNNLGRTWKSANYDRQKTREMIALARKMGATPILFNDRQLRKERKVGYASGHDNHLHICFRNNKKVQQTCNNFKVDPAVCPELQ